jgi:hypothetical protein
VGTRNWPIGRILLGQARWSVVGNPKIVDEITALSCFRGMRLSVTTRRISSATAEDVPGITMAAIDQINLRIIVVLPC